MRNISLKVIGSVNLYRCLGEKVFPLWVKFHPLHGLWVGKQQGGVTLIMRKGLRCSSPGSSLNKLCSLPRLLLFIGKQALSHVCHIKSSLAFSFLYHKQWPPTTCIIFQSLFLFINHITADYRPFTSSMPVLTGHYIGADSSSGIKQDVSFRGRFWNIL